MDNTKRIEGLLLPEEINIADRTLKRALELGASSIKECQRYIRNS